MRRILAVLNYILESLELTVVAVILDILLVSMLIRMYFTWPQ